MRPAEPTPYAHLTRTFSDSPDVVAGPPNAQSGVPTKGIPMSTWVWIIIIVVIVLAIAGYFGRGRLSR